MKSFRGSRKSRLCELHKACRLDHTNKMEDGHGNKVVGHAN